MQMHGREYKDSSAGDSSYRYGFNGKENDNDIENGAQDYGMRIYNSGLGRFMSVDPLTEKYPYLTPYQFASDRPIDGIDLDGLEFFPSTTSSDDGLIPFYSPSSSSSSSGTNTLFSSTSSSSSLTTAPSSTQSSSQTLSPQTTQSTEPTDGITSGLQSTPNPTQGVNVISGAEANKGLAEPPYPSDANVSEYRSTEVDPSDPYVRVSSSVKGNVEGPWVVKQSSIEGMTPEQIQQNLALDYVPDQIGKVDLPPNTLVRAGPVGGNAFGPGNLKITQYQLMEEIPNESFITPTPIETTTPLDEVPGLPKGTDQALPGGDPDPILPEDL